MSSALVGQLYPPESVSLIPGSDVPGILVALEAYILHFLSAAVASYAPLPLARQRAAFVAAKAHALLLSGHTATKRDLYYMAKTLFGRQDNTDAALQRVASDIPCASNDLNIVAASKSLVAGKLSFVSEDSYAIHVDMFGSSGMLIPARPERFLSLSTDAEFVLVVEKETVFTTLAASSQGFLTQSKCLLITGKGYPDKAATLLLARINTAHPLLPILVVTDADPHGLHIALTYHRALPNPGAFRYAGVRPSEMDGMLSELPDTVLLNVTQRETVLATNVVQRTALPQETSESGAKSQLEEIVGEMEYMLQSGVKFEIEALAALPSQQGLAAGHHGFTMSFNPLVAYIQHKVALFAPNASYG